MSAKTAVRTIAPTLALCLLVAAAASAQAVGPATTLRATMVDARVVQGHLAWTDSAMVSLRYGTVETVVPREQIAVMMRRSNRAGTGAKIGAVGGGLLLGTYGVALATGLCERSDGCGEEAIGAGLIGAAVGAASGAILGAVVGVMIPRWVPISTSVTVRQRRR